MKKPSRLYAASLPPDPQLFERLRHLRTELAEEEGLRRRLELIRLLGQRRS